MKTLRYFSLSIVLTLSLSIAGCSHDNIPPDVIGESVMADFLQHAYILEGFYAVETNFQYDTLHPEMLASYDSLLASYDITREDFERSVGWYVRHPDIYKRIHDTVVARIDAEMAAQ